MLISDINVVEVMPMKRFFALMLALCLMAAAAGLGETAPMPDAEAAGTEKDTGETVPMGEETASDSEDPGETPEEEALEEHLAEYLTAHMKTALFPKPLLDLLDKYVLIEERKSKRYEHGVAGIKRIFNCSYPTAHKLMNTIIKPAVFRRVTQPV